MRIEESAIIGGTFGGKDEYRRVGQTAKMYGENLQNFLNRFKSGASKDSHVREIYVSKRN
jgi:hypothetical protein